MSIELIGILTAALGICAVFYSTFAAVTLLCCAALLGSASALAIGQANITPGYLAIGFLGLSMLLRPAQLTHVIGLLIRGRPGFFLLAIMIWAVASGYLLPRMFEGQVLVIPLNSENRFAAREVLRPVGSNINHSVYAIAGPAVFLLIAALARTSQTLERIAFSIMIATALNILIVFADFVTSISGHQFIFDFVRNADYGQAHNHRVMGMKRLTGTFAEASDLAAVTAMLFAFNMRLWRSGVFSRYTGPLALGSLIVIVFSFSSSGYGAVLVYLSLAYGAVLIRAEMLSPNNKVANRNRLIFVSMFPMALFVGMIAMALRPELLDPIVETYNRSFASKLESQSGEQRTEWNTAGLEVFIQTHGLGAGTGSVRTSSFAVAVLANLGIIGAALFILFFTSLFFGGTSAKYSRSEYVTLEIIAAGKAACFVGLVSALVVATSFNFHLFFYILAGVVCASVLNNKYRYAPKYPVHDRLLGDAPPK